MINKQASYRIIYFSNVKRYVALAWNYDQAILFSTTDHETYIDCRRELDGIALSRKVSLKWFDGEYTCKGEGYQLEPTYKIKG